jgi:hypothetical protein
MQGDHKPMIRRKRVTLVRTWEFNSADPAPKGSSTRRSITTTAFLFLFCDAIRVRKNPTSSLQGASPVVKCSEHPPQVRSSSGPRRQGCRVCRDHFRDGLSSRMPLDSVHENPLNVRSIEGSGNQVEHTHFDRLIETILFVYVR